MGDISFGFTTAGTIVFGAGRATGLRSLIAGFGTRPLVCTGSHPERHAELIDSLGPTALTYPVSSEPTVEMTRTAVAFARDHGVDTVIAIGGGSVIDLGKAVAILLGDRSDLMDHLEIVGRGQPIVRPGVPCVAVPTTAGTGAEVTANSVLTVPEHQIKVSLRSPMMLPRIAVVDPLLTVGCPPEVTAASGLDALTQCLEPFVSVMANPLTDGFAREGLRRAAAGLRAAYADGGNLDARTDMALCGLLGGLSLANAKLGAVHGLAGAAGGTIPVPHGIACARLLAPVIGANVEALGERLPRSPALARYAEVARLLTNWPDASPADGVNWIRATVDLLNIPGLSTFGLRPEHLAATAAAAAKANSTKGNPIVLTEEELVGALIAAM